MAGKVTLYTDGACKGNPGPGGWGVVLRYGDNRKTLPVILAGLPGIEDSPAE